MPELPDELPWDTRVTYARLLVEQRPGSREQLTVRVASYLVHIETASSENEFLDFKSARTLGQSLLQLIEQCPEEYMAHLQAAVAYFIHSDDAEHDLDSVVGFDDDVGVFNAVCAHVGLPQLKVAS